MKSDAGFIYLLMLNPDRPFRTDLFHTSCSESINVKLSLNSGILVFWRTNANLGEGNLPCSVDFSFKVAAVLRDEWMWLKRCLICEKTNGPLLFLYVGNMLVWRLSIIQMLSSVSIGIYALSGEDGMQLGKLCKKQPRIINLNSFQMFQLYKGTLKKPRRPSL